MIAKINSCELPATQRLVIWLSRRSSRVIVVTMIQNGITIQNRARLIDRMKDLVNNLRYLEAGPGVINLKSIESITPLSILPISMRLFDYKGMHPSISDKTLGSDMRSCLKTIMFPTGTQRIDNITSATTHIPIIRVTTSRDPSSTPQLLNTTIEKYLTLIKGYLKVDDSGVYNAICYFIEEMITNIEEHAGVSNFFIHCQYWVQPGVIEICIADGGIGFRESYKKAGIRVRGDKGAFENVILGKSSKSSHERGTGIPSTIKILTQSSFKAEVLFISGTTGVYYNRDEPMFIDLQTETGPYSWKGVIFATRFVKPIKTVNIYDFLQ